MGHDYSDSDIRILEGNLEKLNDKWSEYVTHRLNGRDSDLHNPPALNRMAEELLQYVLTSANEEGEIMFSLDLFSGFGANMFAFGQWAAENGLKLTDLLGCKCAEVTSDDIEKLLK